MKLYEFRRQMPKAMFTLAEAERLAWKTGAATLRLQLHHWVRAGYVQRLKRGVYFFQDHPVSQSDAVRVLYGPAYISLEGALNFYGLIPDVVFAMTLVTPRTTRRFKTPLGQFVYRHIQPRLFFGFDPDTLMAEREKAVADFLYLESSRLSPTPECFDGLRWQNLHTIDFGKLMTYARKTGVKKVEDLAICLRRYGET